MAEYTNVRILKSQIHTVKKHAVENRRSIVMEVEVLINEALLKRGKVNEPASEIRWRSKYVQQGDS